MGDSVADKSMDKPKDQSNDMKKKSEGTGMNVGGPSPGGGRGGMRGRGGFRGMRSGGFRGGRMGGHNQDGDGPNASPHGNMGGNRGGNRGGPPNMGGRGGGGSGGHNSGPLGRRDFVTEKLQAIQGPNHELPNLDMTEKKFSGRARLYIGNLAPGTSEDQLKEMMSQFGEIGEIFFNTDKHFAFLRFASRSEAEQAKRELDGQMKNGRALKVRFAPHQGAVKVSNLGPWVSNELLHKAFSIFGDIERCIVLVDERGRSKLEGVIEFERKNAAQEAVRRCQENCYFITSSLRPVVVEMMEEMEDEDGLQEKMLPKRNPDFISERECGPRFANPGSFENEYGQKWKSLHEMKKQKLEALEREMKLEEDKLVAQMEYARYEHETEQLRNQLRMREANRDQQKNQWEERERQMEQRMQEEQERRLEDEQRMMNRMQKSEDNMRQRHQENSLFIQARELNNMLDQQEADMQQGGPFNKGGSMGGPGGPMRGPGGGPGGPMGGPMGDQGMMGGGGFRDGGFGNRGGFGGGNFGPPGGDFGMRGGGNFRGRGGGGPDFGGPNKRRRF